MDRRNFIKAAALALLSTATPLTANACLTNPRTVEKLDLKNGTWHTIPWEALKKGTFFRLRNLDGALEDEGTEYNVCHADEDAAREPAPAYWGVKCSRFMKYESLGGLYLIGEPQNKGQTVHRDRYVVRGYCPLK